MPRETLTILSLESHQDTTQQECMPPSRGLVISALRNGLHPSIALDFAIPSIWYPRLIGSLILQNSNSSSIEDAKDLAAGMEVNGLTPERGGGKKLRGEKSQIQGIP
jgi:hypothetical protein